MTTTPTLSDDPGTTVVLGWDGLDYELLHEFGLADAFGDHHCRIDTYCNDVIGEPHTREIWPTIITGVGPDEHGIYAAEEGEGVQWSNPAIRTAARVAQHTVPEGVKTALGRWLRSQGAGVEKYAADYYDDQGLETVFDGRRSLPIAVPNYWTDLDDQHGFMFDRGAALGKWIDRDSEGWRPADRDQQHALEQEMHAEAAQKLGLVRQAIQREYDLVFAWFGFIDTVGHVEPAAVDPVQRRAYETAAAWTADIRASLAPDDRLVCVSDHGLRGGSHTMDATLAADTEGVTDMVESVFDVTPMLERLTPQRDADHAPPLRAGDSGRVGNGLSADTVRDRLEDLGYV